MPPHICEGLPGESSITDEYGIPSDLERVLPTLSHKEPIRFVSDMHPESILTDLSTRSKGAARESQFGTWVEPARERDSRSRSSAPNLEMEGRLHPAIERYSKGDRPPRVLSGPQKQYLQSAGAFRVLPTNTQDILVTSFFSCIDNLLPILDGGKLLEKYAAGTASTFLIQAICLVTCKTEEAAPYLKLTEDGPVLEPILFARSIHTGLDAAMKADLESDRLTKVQILALMSLHNDGPGEFEESSMHLAQAIHNAHTAGLHIHTAGRRTNDESSYTWWCIWALDKFSACLSGRAVMIADRDIGIARPELESSERSQSLAMWLALADLLEKVINYYRPTANQDSTGWEIDFPSFKEVSYNISIIQPSHKNFFELGYNVISILTCRAGGPTTDSYTRRISAADRIQQIMTTVRNDQLPPLPLVPYAVSLSLTVAYRLLRDKPSSSDLQRAKNDLTIRCEILERQSVRWWSADAMAKLGRKALRSLKTGGVSSLTGLDGDAVRGMMEAEVAMCKHQTDPNLRSTRAGDTRKVGLGTEARNNALELLSAAAATHASHHPHQKQQQSPSQQLQQPKQHQHQMQLDTQPALDLSQVSMYPDQMQAIATAPFTVSMDGVNGTGAAGDQFQNLDVLFGDFFDLGMPTWFEDPMFEGPNAFAGLEGYGEIVG